MELIAKKGTGRCPVDGNHSAIVCSLRGQRRQTARAAVMCPHSLPHKAAAEGRDAACRWEGTLNTLIEYHLLECTKRSDPSYLLNLKIAELQRQNEQLKNENVSLRKEVESLKQRNDEVQRDHLERGGGVNVEEMKRDPPRRRSPPPLQMDINRDLVHVRRRIHHPDTLVFIGGISKYSDPTTVLRKIEQKYRVQFNNFRPPRVREGTHWCYIYRIPLVTVKMAETLCTIHHLDLDNEPYGLTTTLHVRKSCINE